jgi:deazaflavin-dependent oxidoreductase (nitroreductase family)
LSPQDANRGGHENSLIYIKSGPAYVVAASNAGRDTHPGWYFNLLSNPQVLVCIKQQQIKAIAEVASPAQRNLLWEQLVTAAPMYVRYGKQTHREIPMILLHPQEQIAQTEE